MPLRVLRCIKENHYVLTNRLGLFAVEVGHGSSQIGQFADIEWGLYDHYVQIEMDETGGNNFQYLGVTQLLSVPYALYAGNGAGGSDPKWMDNDNGIHFNGGHVGIGTENPGHLLSLDGDVGAGDERFFVSINNSSNFKPFIFCHKIYRRRGYVHNNLWTQFRNV